MFNDYFQFGVDLKMIDPYAFALAQKCLGSNINLILISIQFGKQLNYHPLVYMRKCYGNHLLLKVFN